jgi:hypothetical protein
VPLLDLEEGTTMLRSAVGVPRGNSRDKNGTDTAGYKVIPYPTLMYFSRIRDQIRVVNVTPGL